MTQSQPQLRVLLTNAFLDRPGGSETVIRDVSLGLLRRGHRPTVYAPHLGPPASEIHAKGVGVVSDLAHIAEAPDVIHGQHYVQTAEAFLHFPQATGVQLCHSWLYWQEQPARFAQIHRYIAVDEAVRDRLVTTEGIDPRQVETLHNAVDLTRIPERPEPLPARPRRALAFTKFKAHVPLLEAVCRKHDIQLDVLGVGGSRTAPDPERELVRYDLVFATARMALEALCSGCAVVVCDARGLAGLATSAGLPRLRALNFGLRALVHPMAEHQLAAEIARYDRDDAQRVTAAIRADADLEPMLDRLIGLYRDALAAPRPDAETIRRAELAFLRRNLPRTRSDGRWPWTQEREQLMQKLADLDNRLAAANARLLRPAD